MTLMRWTPWHELESMNRQLSKLLEDGGGYASGEGSLQWAPIVDIRETEDALVVQAELPGIDKKNVKVEVHEGVLTLSGERCYEKDVKEKNVHRVERSYGSFARSFSLPSNIDSGNVQAEMRDGVLEVRLHKRESAKPKSIEVH